MSSFKHFSIIWKTLYDWGKLPELLRSKELEETTGYQTSGLQYAARYNMLIDQRLYPPRIIHPE